MQIKSIFATITFKGVHSPKMLLNVVGNLYIDALCIIDLILKTICYK